MSDVSGGDGWWLASNSKWYPPEEHPSVRAAARSDEERFSALTDAALGAARAREAAHAPVATATRPVAVAARVTPAEAVRTAPQAPARAPIPPLASPGSRPAPYTSPAASPLSGASGPFGGGFRAPGIEGAGQGPPRSGLRTDLFDIALTVRPRRFRSALRRNRGWIVAAVVVLMAAGAAGGYVLASRSAPGTGPDLRARATAQTIILHRSDFPPSWRYASDSTAVGSLALGRDLGEPSYVSRWASNAITHRCLPPLVSVSRASTASFGSPAANASSDSFQTVRFGAVWQITSRVSVERTTKQVYSDSARVAALLSRAGTRTCLNAFFDSVLLTGVPGGKAPIHSILSVTGPPALPGHLTGWSFSLDGFALYRGLTLPFHFQTSEFATGQTEVVLETTGELASLYSTLDQTLLTTLARRAEAARSAST